MEPATRVGSSGIVTEPSATSAKEDCKEIKHTVERKGRHKKKTASRASMACLSCRKRRVRCEVPQGMKECLACKHACMKCFFDKVDERKRPISRAFVYRLINQINVLQEAMVGRLPTGTESGSWPRIQAQRTLDAISRSKRQLKYTAESQWLNGSDEAPHKSPYSIASTPSSMLHESHESAATVPEKTPRLVTPETQAYLLHLYWKFFNSVVPVIHRDIFEAQQKIGSTFISFALLHICMMAVGYRYANKSREDMQRISKPNGDCVLLMKSKSLVAIALERPPSVFLVAALLLLGDMEWAAGRAKQAWLYGRMALRTSFDAGLHLPDHDETLVSTHRMLRCTTLSVCLVSEIYWTNFLDSSSGTFVFGSNPDTVRILSNSCRLVLDSSPTCTREAQVYRELFKLMALVNEIQRIAQSFNRNEHGILTPGLLPLAALEADFLDWSKNLPGDLKWTPENCADAPFSFFLLHQQYHCAVIHLHNTILSMAEVAVACLPGIRLSIHHMMEESRKSCTAHALSVSNIFQQHREQYETQHIFFMAVMHAQVAASALIAAVDHTQSPDKRDHFLAGLRPLSAAFADMARTYQPAKSISIELRRVLAETLSTTDHTAEDSPAEQSTASSSPTSSTAGADASEALESGGVVQGLYDSPQDSGHHYQTCSAHSITSSDGESILQAASTARAGDQSGKATASMHGDRRFPWTPSGRTSDTVVSPKDMSSKDDLHLALFYAPQLRDFAFF